MSRPTTRRVGLRCVGSVGAIALVTSLFPSAAIAGCCDDVLSCAAAVVTGGASCVIENYIATIQTMIASVRAVQDRINQDVNQIIVASRQAITAAGAEIGNLVKSAENDFSAALNQARQLNASLKAQPAAGAAAGSQGSSGAGSGSQATASNGSGSQGPATDAALREAMPRAQAELEKVEPDLKAQAATSRSHTTAAKNKNEAQVPAVQNLVQTVLLAPLQDVMNLLLNLLAHPEQLMNPQAIVDTVILSVTARMAQTMDTVTDQLVNDANASLEASREPTALAQDDAAWAKQVSAAMQLANTQRTQAAIDKLNALLPPKPVTAVAGTVAVGTTTTTVQGTPSGNATAQPAAAAPGSKPATPKPAVNGIRPVANHRALVAKAIPKLDGLRAHGRADAAEWAIPLKRDLAAFKQQQAKVLHPVLPAGVNQSFKSRCDSLLGKLDENQLTQKSSQLTAEAQARFAKDPATLAKVKQLLNQEIERHRAMPKKPLPGPR